MPALPSTKIIITTTVYIYIVRIKKCHSSSAIVCTYPTISNGKEQQECYAKLLDIIMILLKRKIDDYQLLK